MENGNSIKEIINNALNNVESILKTNTIFGQPYEMRDSETGTAEIVIIPVSKISMGFASGGLDLPNGEDAAKNFGGGGGTGVSVVPIGFLTVYAKSQRVEMIPITPTETGPVEQFIDVLNRAPEIIEQIRSAISGEKTEKVTETELNFEDDAN